MLMSAEDCEIAQLYMIHVSVVMQYTIVNNYFMFLREIVKLLHEVNNATFLLK